MYTEVYSLTGHIFVYSGLMFCKYNDFTVYKAGNVIIN